MIFVAYAAGGRGLWLQSLLQMSLNFPEGPQVMTLMYQNKYWGLHLFDASGIHLGKMFHLQGKILFTTNFVDLQA